MSAVFSSAPKSCSFKRSAIPSRRSFVSLRSEVIRPLIPSSFAWKVAAILPVSSCSIVTSTIPFVPAPRTIFKETFTTSSSTRTGIEYCSSFIKEVFSSICADKSFISRISRLVTASWFMAFSILSAASSVNCCCAFKSPSGSDSASANASSTASSRSFLFVVLLLSAVNLEPALFLPPNNCANTWLRFESIASIARRLREVFGTSYFSRIVYTSSETSALSLNCANCSFA